MKKILLFSLIIVFISGILLSFDIPTMTDWKVKGKIQSYNPGNLWELINGAADSFVAFGFQELKSYDIEQKDLLFTVNIYDMGTPLNAYGMYRTENSPKDNSEKIGVESQFSDYQTVMLKGPYYIKVETVKGKTSKSNCEILLKDFAKSLKGNNSYPDEFSFLPKENKLKNSEKFVKENFLGVQELSNCIYAKYKNGEVESKIFIMLPEEGETPSKLLEKLSKKWTVSKHGKHKVFKREIPYTGVVGLSLHKGKLIGISGYKTEPNMLKALDNILN